MTTSTVCSLGSLDPKHGSLSNLDGFSMDKNLNHVFLRNLDPKHGSLSNQAVKSLGQLDRGYHLVPFPKEVVPNVSSLKKLSKDYMFFSSILSMEKKWGGENLRKKLHPRPLGLKGDSNHCIPLYIYIYIYIYIMQEKYLKY
jgi:hypothetical protein